MSLLTKKALNPVLATAVGLVLGVSGCVVREYQAPPPPPPQPAEAPPPGAEVDVDAPPPPDQDVVVGVAPGPDYVWVGGYWGWYGGRWVCKLHF